MLRLRSTQDFSSVKAEARARFLAKDSGGKASVRSFVDESISVTKNIGAIDPRLIEDYIARGGYDALEQALFNSSPGNVIDTVKTSGLQGRGGAGFPTGLKWQFTAEASETQRYIDCNGEEGDPGLEINRMLLEGDPYRIIEGITIAAYAVGAHEGFVYLNNKYKTAADVMNSAIVNAENAGLLGEKVFGTEFSLKLKTVIGEDRYICGEETSQLSSIEGKRVEPTGKRPTVSGLYGKPTLVNNVETYANIPGIILGGGEAFSAFGTGKSKGSKMLSLSGALKIPGVVEVPMGMTLQEIIDTAGCGMKDGLGAKAILLGGPLGSIVPAQHFDTPLAYEELAKIDSGVGAGGFQVINGNENAAKVCREILRFCQEQSCGKCLSCRIGSKRLLESMDRIIEGKGSMLDMEALRRLNDYLNKTSFCALGRSVTNTLRSVMRFFPEDLDSYLSSGTSEVTI